MSGSIYAYPDVYPVTQDLSAYIQSLGSTVGVAVGASDRGPVMERVPITNSRTFLNFFGNPNPLTSYLHYTVLAALQEMRLLYVTRVVGTGAKMASVGIGNSFNYSNAYGTGVAYPFIDEQTLFGVDAVTSLVFYAANPGTWGNNLSIHIDNVVAADSTNPDSFDITIYEAVQGINVIHEKWIGCSTYKTLPGTASANLNGFKQSRFVEDMINSRSNLCRVAFNTEALQRTPAPTLNVVSLTTSAQTSSGNTLTFAATTGVILGQHIVGTNIDPAARVSAVTGTTVTLTIPVTGTVASGATILFETVGSPVKLTGGTNGSAVSDSAIAQGWNLYSDRNTITIDVLLNSGYVTDDTFGIHAVMDSLCESRQDCFAILDVPYDQQAMDPETTLTDWRNFTQNMDTSFSALYAGWPLVWDSINDIHKMPMPVSGFAAQVFARRDYAKGVIWYPPAGFQHGVLQSGVLPIEGLSVYYDEGLQGLVYQAGINYIRMFIGGGYVLWGQKTLQYLASALDRINVRRLVIAMVRSIRKFLIGEVFELNNVFTRQIIKNNIDQYMQYVQGKNGVYRFKTVCDTTNNSNFDIDNNTLNVEVRIQPQKAAEYIIFTTTIQKTGADLNTSFTSTTSNDIAL